MQNVFAKKQCNENPNVSLSKNNMNTAWEEAIEHKFAYCLLFFILQEMAHSCCPKFDKLWTNPMAPCPGQMWLNKYLNQANYKHLETAICLFIMPLSISLYKLTRILPILTKACEIHHFQWSHQWEIFWCSAEVFQQKVQVNFVHSDENNCYTSEVIWNAKLVSFLGIKLSATLIAIQDKHLKSDEYCLC